MIKKIKPRVFYPPFLLLLVAMALSFLHEEAFIQWVTWAKAWVLDNLGWLFSLSGFFMLAVCIITYCSPFGRVIIGGPDAKPFLTRWRWFAIALCTGIGVGIVLWCAPEPLHHLSNPPTSLNIKPNSPQAALFSLSTVYLHWTFVPYALYTVVGLTFAYAFYNLKKPFSLRSPLEPLLGRRCPDWLGDLVDAICLYALVAGVAASLGGGMLLISGGLNHIFGIPSNTVTWGFVGLAIVGTFTLSAVSGLVKGIRMLSNLNMILFIALMIYIFVAGPTTFILNFGIESFGHFLGHFFERSLATGAAAQDDWVGKWTIFYWAWWFAWAPIVGVFLGRISYGYSVRQCIWFNLVLPALFGVAWMAIFGGTAIHMELYQDIPLVKSLHENGEEAVMYALLSYFPGGKILIPVFLFTAFVSFVTAADSNTSAMSGLSSTGISPDSPEPGALIKITWGVLIGLVSWVMISFAHIEGIKIISILGGLPALLLCLALTASLIKIVLNVKE